LGTPAPFFSDSVSLVFRIFPNAVLGVILFFSGAELTLVVRDIGDRKTDFYVMLVMARLRHVEYGPGPLCGRCSR
jgi:hypothetical protein